MTTRLRGVAAVGLAGLCLMRRYRNRRGGSGGGQPIDSLGVTDRSEPVKRISFTLKAGTKGAPPL